MVFKKGMEPWNKQKRYTKKCLYCRCNFKVIKKKLNKDFCNNICWHNFCRGKSIKEIYGVKKAKNISKKISKKSTINNIISWKNLKIRQKRIKGLKNSECWKSMHTLEARKKSRKSQIKSFKTGKRIQWNDEYTKETHPSLLKMSKIKLVQNKGINNPNWQDGKSFEPYSKEFDKQLKKLIKIRDNYRCQICNIHNNKVKQGLCIHHIDYDKKNCKLKNLISLCHKCHSKTNGNREYWTKYFS